MRRLAVPTVFCLLCVLVSVLSACAQTASTGALTVNVTDPSGAVIAGATVTATNAAGTSRTLTTGPDGSCTFTLLPPDSYQLSIAAQGFKTFSVTSVTVNVAETHVLTQALEVGTQTQEVTVHGAVQTIQTESSTVGTVVGERAVVGLPLATRNFTQILGLSTGINAPVNNASSLGRGNEDTFVNGTGDISTNYQQDGSSITGFMTGSTTDPFFGLWGSPPIASPDAIQEFKVQTSQYDAEYGKGAGANVNIVTKTGTNALHGSLFEFVRNDLFNANGFFQNEDGLPRGELKQNQYGATIGGPILKNKLFVFASYQGTRQLNAVASQGFSTIELPPQLTDDRTAAALGAAFCPGNYTAGAPGAVYANTNFPTPTNSVQCDGSNINPVALNFLNAKLPNGQYAVPSPTKFLNAGEATEVGEASFAVPASFREEQGLLNLDYIISPKETLALKMFYAWGLQVTTFQGADPPGGAQRDFSGAIMPMAKLTSIISNNLINEARISWLKTPATEEGLDPLTASGMGITPAEPWDNVMPVVVVSNLGLTVGGSDTDTGSNPQEAYEVGDQISWNHGRHTVRTGFDTYYGELNLDIFGRTRGQLTFPTFADLLLGETAVQNGTSTLPQEQSNISAVSADIQAPNGTQAFLRAHYIAGFFQDDFKMNSRLTWNLGLRWEYSTVPYDVDPANDETNFNYQQMLAVPVPPSTGSYAGFTAGPVIGTPLPPGIVQRPLRTYTGKHAPWDMFQPRIGFAWQPFSASGRFVIRGGFGMFNTGITGASMSQPASTNPPNALPVSRSGTTNLLSSWQEPFNPAVSLGFAAAERFPTSSFSLTEVDPTLRPSTIFSESLNFQYAFTPSLFWEFGYVGTRDEHIMVLGNSLNIPQLASPSAPVDCDFPSGCVTANGSGGADGPKNRVPIMGVVPYGFSDYCACGDSDYSSLQTSLRKNFSHGLQFEASYTYGRTFTDVRGTSWIVAGSFSSNLAYPYDVAQERGPADFDRPQRLVVSYLYNLPSFRGSNGFLGKALSGWGVSGVTTAQSGNPLTLTSSGNLLTSSGLRPGGGGAYSSTSSRAQLCPGVTKANIYTSGGIVSRLNDYFNPSAFCAVPLVPNASDANATGFGNSPAGFASGPGQFNWDLAITKHTVVGGINEGASLEFRSEFYNAFNHPQFSSPVLNANSPTFGAITSTSVGPRIIQFGLKYVF